MKRVLLAICFIQLTHLIYAQCEEDISPQIVANYSEIVELLALPASTGLFADSAIMNEIFMGMNAIFQAEDIAEVDTVFNIYCINSNYFSYDSTFYNSMQFEFQLDTAVAWTENWINGSNMSGDSTIDSTLANIDYYTFSLLGITLMQLNTAANYAYLEQFFSMQPGILEVTFQPSFIGSGSFITYSLVDNIKYYDFQLGWGDCPSGCINRRTFSFSVDESCLVTFLEASGNNLIQTFPSQDAPVINCNLSNAVPSISNNYKVNVLGNPFAEKIVFNVVGKGTNKLSYQLKGVDGLTIDKGTVRPINGIDTDHLSNGIYILVIHDDINFTFSKKLVKAGN